MVNTAEAKARCWAEVDLGALSANYREAKAMLKPGVMLVPVLKANAYGLGAAQVARALNRLGAGFFAVAALSEAEELLHVLPGCRVLVMGLVGEPQLERAIRIGARVTLFSMDGARALSDAAVRLGLPATAHVKLDTGLHRLGFSPDQFDELEAVAALDGLSVEGLYTHLALRDAASDREQLDLIYAARVRYGRLVMVHALDSIGMVRYPDDQMDAVRVGAWLYGVCPNRYPHPERCLLTVQLKARVAQIRRVPAGQCIGYDEDHPLRRDSRIATLSAGYADGYPRLNDAGEVEICGHRAPVKGLVCMDQMMVDVTDIPDAREGDEATLLGGSIGINEYAGWGALNRNEALSRLSRRVPRVYVDAGDTLEIVDYMEKV